MDFLVMRVYEEENGSEIDFLVMRVYEEKNGSKIDFCHEGFRKGREV